MDRRIANIIWKPFFAAFMTGLLSLKTGINPLLIGALLGIAAAWACYEDLKKLGVTSEKSEEV